MGATEILKLQKMPKVDPESGDEDDPKIKIAKTPAELQRLRLERLMKNPQKPVFIPEPRKEKKFPEPPEFVRNVMGSSAGAGSGEFHIYRHIRRREYARQDFIKHKAVKEEMDEKYHEKLEENQRLAEERTAKRRAKRLKKKEKMKEKGKVKKRKTNEGCKEEKQGTDEDSGGSEPDLKDHEDGNLSSNDEGQGTASKESGDEKHEENKTPCAGANG
ncbi:unnamed protein product [Darwinula stevensoni]|uniref:PRKR-interacting protein 1 n=1 Tax=Darwinula stevensoni TaxID=69355 RepID=A0A7R8X4Q4_9CRUS|nr:unnamed protein product [Darwinula stevensoni]CAG0886286.1 unnamed protein product [Darwinula stevensoni]